MLFRSEYELSLNYEAEGVTYKARPDFYSPINGMVIDLKTTAAISNHGIRKSAYEYYYDVQAAMMTDACYLNKLECWKVVFLFVSKAPPHDVRLIEFHPENINAARIKYLNLGLQLKQAIELEDFRSKYPDEVECLDLGMDYRE